jgi:hypothetical protein
MRLQYPTENYLGVCLSGKDCKEVLKMKTKHARGLPDPVNVRLPEPLLVELREQALKNERTLSGEIRWLLQRSVEEKETGGRE